MMNKELEEGEIPDATFPQSTGLMAGTEVESWSKRWKIVTSSRSGGMYFSCVESNLAIWVSDVGKVCFASILRPFRWTC